MVSMVQIFKDKKKFSSCIIRLRTVKKQLFSISLRVKEITSRIFTGLFGINWQGDAKTWGDNSKKQEQPKQH